MIEQWPLVVSEALIASSETCCFCDSVLDEPDSGRRIKFDCDNRVAQHFDKYEYFQSAYFARTRSRLIAEIRIARSGTSWSCHHNELSCELSEEFRLAQQFR